jgi:hypothetical protein
MFGNSCILIGVGLLYCTFFFFFTNDLVIAVLWSIYYVRHFQEDFTQAGESGATLRPVVEYVVIPSLPRGACVEWQVYARSEQTAVTGKLYHSNALFQ